MNKEHFKKIISGYKSAPINQLYKPEMYLDLGKCTIEINILDKFHHSARSLHGSVYFKMLDDAAWGASNTYVKDVFLFTYKFSVCLKRPVSKGAGFQRIFPILQDSGFLVRTHRKKIEPNLP